MEEELFELYKNILFLSMKTGLYEKIDKYNFSFLQRNLLIFVSKHKGIMMNKLGKSLSLQKPAVTRIVDTLEDKGLLKRTDVPEDRRGYAIVLTSKGRGLINRLEDKPISVMKKILSMSTSREISEIQKGLKTFNTKLSSINRN